MGTGHVHRCLAIARTARAEGHRVSFVAKAHAGHILNTVRNTGFDVHALPVQASKNDPWAHSAWVGGDPQSDGYASARACTPDAWLCDHYGLDARWVRGLRSTGFSGPVLWLDDIGNRPLGATHVIDPGACASLSTWQYLCPDAHIHQGPQWAPLDAAFAHEPIPSSDREGCIVFFGGVDAPNATSRTLEALAAAGWKSPTTIVVGTLNPHSATLRAWAAQAPFSTACLSDLSPQDMRKALDKAWIGIGCGGMASWERATTGLPTLTTHIADNQKHPTDKLAHEGVTLRLPYPLDHSYPGALAAGIAQLRKPAVWARMSKRARAFCDAQGTLRILHLITTHLQGLH